jgi:hypothetical protein
MRFSSQFSRKQVSLVYDNRAAANTVKGLQRRTQKGNLFGVTGHYIKARAGEDARLASIARQPRAHAGCFN